MPSPALSFHAFLCLSLNGFIAREDGSVNFPDEAIAGKQVPEGEDFGIAAFMSSVDAVVMGRTTYELGFKKDGHGWQYGSKPLFVLSRSLENLPEGSPESVRLLRPSAGSGTDMAFVVDALEVHFAADSETAEKRVYVDGGTVVRQSIAEGRLDEITITLIPILIGSGIELFGPLKADVKSELVECKSWEVGYVQLRYKLRKS
jgi:dihydrofolate reductase